MKAIYPGSFDPVTNGHLDIISRASGFLDELYVAAIRNSEKSPTFTVEERLEMLREATAHMPNVRVVSFSGLVARFASDNDISLLIRGVRALTDFETEFQMALINRNINKKLETLFMPADGNYMYLSSSVVKEVCALGGDISEMVCPFVARALRDKGGYAWNR